VQERTRELAEANNRLNELDQIKTKNSIATALNLLHKAG